MNCPRDKFSKDEKACNHNSSFMLIITFDVVLNICVLHQGLATHGIIGAMSGGSGAAKYNFISYFLNLMTIKIFSLILVEPPVAGPCSTLLV